MTRPFPVFAPAVPLLVVFSALVVSASGCSSKPESAVARTRDHVASAVHVSLDSHGVPVQDGVVDCEGPGPNGAIYCDATTAYVPQAEILATFRASRPAPPAGCPGILEITVGGAPLATSAEDPCR